MTPDGTMPDDAVLSPSEPVLTNRETHDVIDYQSFCESKMRRVSPTGIPNPPELSAHLFPMQRDLVRVALMRGKCALFADTGLGKTAMQIEWARVVHEHTGGNVLILAPLAVAAQTSKEGARFGVDVTRVDDQSEMTEPGIYVTNYDKLHRFETVDIAGIVLDESSIIKSSTGSTRAALIERFARTPFKLACTATPAPNDWTELGNHSQFLGVRTREEMLAEFFVHDGGSTRDWRIKGHAVEPFWRWVASWALVVGKPSDLGYEDGSFTLPPLITKEEIVSVDDRFARAAGVLFLDDVVTLADQREMRRASLAERVKRVAEVVATEPNEPWVVWCDMNDEADAIEKAIADAVQVAGSDSASVKESRMTDFSEGRTRVLVSKSSICGFGMNWQHCARTIFAGPTHSFEQFYQAVRRFWRFGQKRPVHVHMVATDADKAILDNLKRKERDAAELARSGSRFVCELTKSAVLGVRADQTEYVATKDMMFPTWLKAG